MFLLKIFETLNGVNVQYYRCELKAVLWIRNDLFRIHVDPEHWLKDHKRGKRTSKENAHTQLGE